MRKIFLLFMLLLNLQVSAQADFDKSIDKQNGSVVLKGQFRFADLINEADFKWLDAGISRYKPDTSAVSFLSKHLPEYSIVVIMGTWCEDSQILIPQLYKTVIAADYPVRQIDWVGVDRAKQAKYIEHQLYRVEKVPTIILFNGELEAGRIVEVTQQNVEKDLVEIIRADWKRIGR